MERLRQAAMDTSSTKWVKTVRKLQGREIFLDLLKFCLKVRLEHLKQYKNTEPAISSGNIFHLSSMGFSAMFSETITDYSEKIQNIPLFKYHYSWQ